MKNPWMELTLDETAAAFHVASLVQPGLGIERARLRAVYRDDLPWPLARRHTLLAHWRHARLGPVEERASAHGPLHMRTLALPPDEQGVVVTVTFALAVEQPLLLWQMQLQNQGRAPVRVERLEMLEAGFLPAPGAEGWRTYQPGRLRFPARPLDPVFFSNGWGSWDDTRAYTAEDHFRGTRLGPFTRPMRQNPGTPHPRRRGRFGSDMFGILGDRESQTAILAGFLAQREHFGSLEAYLGPLGSALSLWANGDEARLDPGRAMTTDWACLFFLDTREPEAYAPYYDAVSREHGLSYSPTAPLHTGWCSWYQFFTHITEPVIQRNLEAAAGLAETVPLTLFQIDDGYQAALGDWLHTQPAFPNGMAPLAAAIRERQMQPGLWIAPFTVHPRSELARAHPDWLLRNRWGRPVSAGYNWGVFHQALDLTHPEALAYVGEVIETAAAQWGYSYLKLDFLYAGALAGRRRDPTLTRAQALRRAFMLIREKAGRETTLLGCGAPLGPAIGLVDAMRIGPDVAPRWFPKEMGITRPIQEEPGMPSARNAIHNTLQRAPMHLRWWVNDGDCLVARPDCDLALPEIQSVAAALALTGSPLLLSDDLGGLPPERLRLIQALLPLIGRRAQVLDWFDQSAPTRVRLDLHGPAGVWHLLGVFNWEAQPVPLVFDPAAFRLAPAQPYQVRSFWTGHTWRTGEAGAGTPVPGTPAAEMLPPHGCAVLAVRSQASNAPLYLGSDLHISQGLEVTRWQSAPGRLSLRLERPARADGHVDLWLPAPPRAWQASRGAIGQPQEIAPGVFRLPVAFDLWLDMQVEFEALA